MSDTPPTVSDAPPASPVAPAAPRAMRPATWAWFAFLMICTALVTGVSLRGGAAFEPVDAWVAQTAREMYENTQTQGWRGFLVPEFSGETRLQKSPGAYWAVMAVAWLRGGVLDETTVRVPNFVGCLLTVATIFWLTQRIAGDRPAIFAGFATASSAMVLFWSGRGSADMLMTGLMTLALASFWVGLEDSPAGWKRTLLVLGGYLSAGLAMLYKMPMPLVCVWLPALAYVLLVNRWRILASWQHLVGALLFFLPWAPWFLLVIQVEPVALDKWRVEFFDRVTGDLPNVKGQDAWHWYFFYLIPMFAFSVPYMLSIPGAIRRAFQADPAIQRRGQWFLLIWIGSLFLFFTLSVGKETRYFLPAMPPLFCLLGIELAAFFHPQRNARPALDRLAFFAVCGVAIGGLIAAFLGIKSLYKHAELSTFVEWNSVWPPTVIAIGLLGAGAVLAAWLFWRRRESAAFAALVGGMWAMWLVMWPFVMPVLVSSQPFKELAAKLRALPPEQQAALRQVAQQDPRLIWYSDVRFPRLVDQLDLLESLQGQRDIEREKEIWGVRMTDELDSPDLILMVSAPLDYLEYMLVAPERLAAVGRAMPTTHIWLTAQTGHPKQRYIVFGNRPPPWPELSPPFKPERVAQIRAAHEAAARLLAERRHSDAAPASSAPTSTPASAPASNPAAAEPAGG